MIRNAVLSDAPQIAAIYNHYVAHTIVTFEEEALNATEMSDRIAAITKKYPWIVYESAGQIMGYAYAADWKVRRSYRFSLEGTVYLKKGAERQGIGSALYGALIDLLKPTNIHALIGGISLPNEASIALHEKFGFKKVAHFPEVGYKFEKWIDVGYWQLML
ncbi:MAG: N-acetyltransferase [Cyclobacteriaceae bacterium]|nr:N-acetyltransferase [Cyclobacteriaceae bacterium]